MVEKREATHLRAGGEAEEVGEGGRRGGGAAGQTQYERYWNKHPRGWGQSGQGRGRKRGEVGAGVVVCTSWAQST